MQTTSLSADFFNPCGDDIRGTTDFAEVQRRRLAAQQAFLKADTDYRLRRAMNKTFCEQAELPGVGQRCFYWRVQPARVVAHETNDEKKVVVVWVAHGTNLLRCAPHQVRPVVEETGYATVADPAAAMEALRDLCGRSTTQFRDVMEPEPAMQDVLDEARDETLVSRHGADSSAQPSLTLKAPRPHRPLRLRSRNGFAQQPPPLVAPPLLLCPPPLLFSLLELAVEDVFIVDGGANDLPEGWAVMDGDLVLDEVWLTREVSEKKLSVSERLQMIDAKKAELQSYFANKVWEFEDPKPGDSARTISARWVLTFKQDPPGSTPRAKARLVLRGFQDPDMGSIETSSPTAARQAKFVLLALAPVMSWTLYAGDVKTAFLSGSTFARRILVRLPADCRPLLGVTGDGPTFMRMLKSA